MPKSAHGPPWSSALPGYAVGGPGPPPARLSAAALPSRPSPAGGTAALPRLFWRIYIFVALVPGLGPALLACALSVLAFGYFYLLPL